MKLADRLNQVTRYGRENVVHDPFFQQWIALKRSEDMDRLSYAYDMALDAMSKDERIARRWASVPHEVKLQLIDIVAALILFDRLSLDF